MAERMGGYGVLGVGEQSGALQIPLLCTLYTLTIVLPLVAFQNEKVTQADFTAVPKTLAMLVLYTLMAFCHKL